MSEMTDKEFVLSVMKRHGLTDAESLQERSADMDGTEINAEDFAIPDFREAVRAKNMLERPIGFICKSSAGRVVRLLQAYDSTIYTQEPEELPAQFGFVWSKDPKKAKPFIALSTSPYNTGDCCTEDGTFRSTMDGNVWSPSTYPQGWETIVME